MSEGIFPPVKCATGLRYAPTSSMSRISLDFLKFSRKRNLSRLERKENGRHYLAAVGTKTPTKVPPDVRRMFRGEER
jgi:hypothetical protein